MLGIGLGLQKGGVLGAVFLLNEFSGAAAGYSLRKLSKNTTNVIKVRRSSDNAEDDFTASQVKNGTLTSWVNEDVVTLDTNFVDSNSDGVADSVSNVRGSTATIVTGNGHVGNAQRFDYNSSGSGLQSIQFNNIIQKNTTITLSFYYRSNKSCSITNGSQGLGFSSLPATTGNAVFFSETVSIGNYSGGNDLYLSSWLNTLGDWFEVSDLTITQTEGNGFVTTLYDQSGNNNDMVQATAGSQPKIVDAGVLVTENGRPAILMDNTDDALSSNLGLSSTSTIFSAFRNFDNIGVLYSGTTIGSDFIYAFRNNSGGIASGVTVSSTHKNGNLQTLTNQLDVLNSINTGSMILWSSLLTSVDTARYSDFRIGNSVLGATNVKWTEIIIYNSDQSTNRTAIEDNINKMYNIY